MDDAHKSPGLRLRYIGSPEVFHTKFHVMLETTDRSIETVIAMLAKSGVEAGYLVPTTTGLEKSILDAHAGLRDYFRLTKFHEYQTQPQGTSGKRITQGFFVTPEGMTETKVSLYRPDTKTGDPRIWIYGLKYRAQPGNLLAIFAYKGSLYIVNASDRNMLSDQGLMHLHLDSMIRKLVVASNQVAMELLDRLKVIAHTGWVNSMRSGPTGVGYTLETLLGICANSNKAPDYKGIEIKAGRTLGGRQASRTTLFSKTPDWSRSTVSNGLGLLDAYGYRDARGRLQLYCSLNNQSNTLGHYLDIQDDDLMLHAMHQQPNTGAPANRVLLWDMDQLRSSLAEKHKETFWVKAKVKRNANGQESFHYTDVIHTKGPLLGNMVEMFKLGHIELDYLIHEEWGSGGGRKSRDHGYLFKIWQKNLSNLFPPPTQYSLL